MDTLSLQNQFGFGYPATVFLGAIFIFISRLFSQNDPVLAVNLMSVVMSSLCIPVFFAIAEKLFGRLTAALSSILFSLTPIFLGVSVFGKSHTPSLFFLLLSLYSLLTFFDTRAKRLLIAGGFFMGLMGAARLQDMVLMVIPFSFLCVLGTNSEDHSKTRNESLQRLSVFWVTALAVTLIGHLPFLLQKDHALYAHNILKFWGQGITWNFRGMFSSSLAVSFVFLIRALSEAGSVMSLVGLVFIGKKSPRILFFFLLWLCFPLFFYGNLHTTVPRFFTFILPPLIMAQGYLFAKSMSINSAFRITSTAIYCLILYLTFTSIFPLLYARHAYALLPDYAKWVSKTMGKDAWLITTDDRLFYEYYGNVNVLGRPLGLRFLEQKALSDFKKKVDALLDNNTAVYITSVGLFSYDPDKKFSSLMNENYRWEIVGTRPYEDWHRDILKQNIVPNQLFRITPGGSM
ncbi:MAG: glycosyltransferase family 39 protein [Candidatus Omnitrophica bacterium]|nr:glycosyltransferase family 39 protein [Candidatus Omnitrophota bacterium]